jgi:hypothetical protein
MFQIYVLSGIISTQSKKQAVLRDREQDALRGRSHASNITVLVVHGSCRHIASNNAIRDATRKSHAVLPVLSTMGMGCRVFRLS